MNALFGLFLKKAPKGNRLFLFLVFETKNKLRDVMRFFLLILLWVPLSVCAQDVKQLTRNLKQLFSDGISEKSLANYTLSDSSQWVLTKNGKTGRDIKCMGGTPVGGLTVKPKVFALINNITVGDFVMEFDFLQRGKDFGLRDLCVVYAYSDSVNYCFAQAASEEDRYVHNVFVVNGNARPKKIGTAYNKGVVWGYEKWHKVTVVRQTNSNTVKLFVDGELVVETINDPGLSGQLGFGSFGSEFKIDNIVVWGVNAQ
jgi:hypothetical protein